jgi:sec-independent protein translocase protein TatC
MSDPQETFIAHLIELRDHLMRIVIAIAVVFVGLMIWPGAAKIYDILAHPLMAALPEGAKMIATGVITPILIPLKITGWLAMILTLPYALYQIWSFVAPGLYAHEKRIILPLVVASTLLFMLGMAFCYFFVFGKIFAVINELAPKSITPAPDIENYLSFVLTMFLAFGVTFEIPVVVVALVRMGLITVAKLKEIRSYVIVGAFVVAAVVTPPDALSQLMLAIPMCLLYEAGIIAASFIKRPEQSTQTESS